MSFTLNPTEFRADYPEFCDEDAIPDGVLTRWGLVASKMLSPSRWGDLLGFGTGLFVAHQLAMRKQNLRLAEVGGTPGQINGPTTSKTVSKVSVSYDPSLVAIKDAGNYNATSYGRDFMFYALQVGAGPVQLGGSGFPATEAPGVDVFWGLLL